MANIFRRSPCVRTNESILYLTFKIEMAFQLYGFYHVSRAVYAMLLKKYRLQKHISLLPNNVP